jgi:hypothetical protein
MRSSRVGSERMTANSEVIPHAWLVVRELWRTFSGTASLMFELNFLSRRFAQCTQVSVHRARLTKNKT